MSSILCRNTDVSPEGSETIQEALETAFEKHGAKGRDHVYTMYKTIAEFEADEDKDCAIFFVLGGNNWRAGVQRVFQENKQYSLTHNKQHGFMYAGLTDEECHIVSYVVLCYVSSKH
jgi:hypothetical protein